MQRQALTSGVHAMGDTPSYEVQRPRMRTPSPRPTNHLGRQLGVTCCGAPARANLGRRAVRWLGDGRTTSVSQCLGGGPNGGCRLWDKPRAPHATTASRQLAPCAALRPGLRTRRRALPAVRPHSHTPTILKGLTSPHPSERGRHPRQRTPTRNVRSSRRPGLPQRARQERYAPPRDPPPPGVPH